MANSSCNWYMLNPGTRFDQDSRCSHVTKMFDINFVYKCSKRSGKRCSPGCTEREQGPVYFAGRRHLPCGNNHQMFWCHLCHILLTNDKSEGKNINLLQRQIIQVQKRRQFRRGILCMLEVQPKVRLLAQKQVLVRIAWSMVSSNHSINFCKDA